MELVLKKGGAGGTPGDSGGFPGLECGHNSIWKKAIVSSRERGMEVECVEGGWGGF